MKTYNDYDEKRNRRITVAIVITTALVIILMLFGVIAAMNYETWFGDAPSDVSGETETSKERLGVDPGAGDYVEPETSAQSEGGGIAIPGWGRITIPAGKTEVTVDFPNPEENSGKYYLTFELRLKDTGEILYTSGLVPPGKHIQKITLSRALEAGTYAAVIHVQPYKMDEAQTPTNNADMETELIVY